jgi:hypothetical protein
MKPIHLLLICALAAGCSKLPLPSFKKSTDQPAGSEQPRPQARPETSAEAPPSNARTAEQFDTTSAEDRAAATSQSGGGETSLGVTVASLGDPTKPGFWLETPLVRKAGKGKVVYAGSGRSVKVDLIPIDGASTAGSRISLPAMRLLDAPLAGLPELQVFLIAD